MFMFKNFYFLKLYQLNKIVIFCCSCFYEGMHLKVLNAKVGVMRLNIFSLKTVRNSKFCFYYDKTSLNTMILFKVKEPMTKMAAP